VPIYEYACRKCRKRFEYIQRMSDPPKRKCEACGGQTLERQISQTSFHLKGSGWYKDLYSSPKPAAGASEGKSEGGGSSSDAGSPAGSGTAAAPASDPGSSSGSKPGSDSGSGKSSDGARPGKKARKGSP
jgi:putative FmdB family regulatory protein